MQGMAAEVALRNGERVSVSDHGRHRSSRRLACAAMRCGRYLVRGFLASGGMGCVLDAEDIVARRRVALKARSSGSAANIWSSYMRIWAAL